MQLKIFTMKYNRFLDVKALKKTNIFFFLSIHFLFLL